jgi:peptidylprolyl isomerase
VTGPAPGSAVVAVIAALAAACGPRSTPAPPAIDNGPARADAAPAPPPAPGPGPTARRLDGGVIIETLAAGSEAGVPPARNDRVTLTLRDPRPGADERVIEVPRHQLGDLEVAVARMVPDETARVWIPTVDPGGRDAEPLVIDIVLDTVVRAPPVPPDVGVVPANAVVLPSGLAHVVLVPGHGPTAALTDDLTIHITGWDPDGVMVDHTARDYPAGIAMSRHSFTGGMSEALGTMSVGQRSRFWIPGPLVDEDPDVTMTYEIELVAVRAKPPPPATPKDVARPPRGAKRTKAGVSYRFLARAKQKGARPTATSRVRVHYSGWTTDGKLFDSSITRGTPADFPLGSVIAGWTDVLQVMTPGDRIRAWIPEALAYQGRPGPPQGMLVFDIELIEILP